MGGDWGFQAIRRSRKQALGNRAILDPAAGRALISLNGSPVATCCCEPVLLPRAMVRPAYS